MVPHAIDRRFVIQAVALVPHDLDIRADFPRGQFIGAVRYQVAGPRMGVAIQLDRRPVHWKSARMSQQGEEIRYRMLKGYP